MVKKLFNALVCGAAAALGSIFVTKGVKALNDPYKKAEIKNGFKRIKDAFLSE